MATTITATDTSPATAPSGAYVGSTGYVYNENVASLQRRINHAIVEIFSSQSNGVQLNLAADQTRWMQYLTSLTSLMAFFTSLPQDDRPKTYQNIIQLDPLPVVTEVDNDDVGDLIRMLENFRDEVVNSQSARLASGFLSYDAARIANYIARIENFLTNYVAKVTPIDLPASNPNAPLATQPVTGV